MGFGVENGGGIRQAQASTSTSTTQTINVTVNQVITLSLSGANLNLPTLTPGTAVIATSSATVTTNAVSGWQLQVNRNSATSTIASGTITFPDQTAFTGNNATSAANLANSGANLSFREYQTGTSAGDYSSATWGTADTDPSAFYAGFPTSAVTYASTSTYTGTAQTVVMEVRANAPATQQATTYTGAITITAVALP
ncbi:MAG TPA: hypothetical protein VMA75_01700 [Candidatus Paceibacterota bacterium]|nr:hypothetical protein [Candidatus Paceibacterota bacterium]